MPRPYPSEFRARASVLVRSGKEVNQTALELEISAGCLHTWLRQDRIDRCEIAGTTTIETDERRAARKRVRELVTEPEIMKQAAKFLGPGPADAKGDSPGDQPPGRHRASCRSRPAAICDCSCQR